LVPGEFNGVCALDVGVWIRHARVGPDAQAEKAPRASSVVSWMLKSLLSRVITNTS